jgi:uncharacterized protein with HEPN domain
VTEPRDVRVYLADILENLRLAREFVAGLTSATELGADKSTLYAVVRAFEIVGEAARHIPTKARALAPDIPWSSMTGMRDRLIHGYREIDLDLLWRTATVRAAEAEPLIEALLARLDAEAADAPEG